MTEPAAAVEISTRISKSITLQGREILIQTPTETQVIQLAHEGNVFQDKSGKIPTDRKIKSLDRFFRILVSMIVTEEDREFVEDGIADGDIHALDVMREFDSLFGDTGSANTQPGVRRARASRRN